MDPSALLRVLQYSDSFFPSGANAFSWGLESLYGDRRVTNRDQLQRFLTRQLHARWSGFDRPLLLAAGRLVRGKEREVEASSVQAELVVLDRLCDAMNVNQGGRLASRRLGASLLKTHADLGLDAAREYGDLVHRGIARGHLPVVQGYVWALLAIAESDAQVMSAFGLSVAIVSASIRIGIVGHLHGQQVLTAARLEIDKVLSEPSASVEDIWTGTPLIDVAAMRHEQRSARLFAT